jgi:hypothetical protein
MRCIRWATRLAVAAVWSLAVTATSRAAPDNPNHNNNTGNDNNPKPNGVAPEISPAGAGAVVTLLVGGTVLLTNRRRSRAA